MVAGVDLLRREASCCGVGNIGERDYKFCVCVCVGNDLNGSQGLFYVPLNLGK